MKCQICGKTKGLRADGTIAHHHCRSDLCPGALRLPWEISCDAIEAEISRLEAAAERSREWFARYLKGNRPPIEGEFAAWGAALKDLDRMRARRKRWDRRLWVEYWCPETESFRRRPPSPEAA